MQLFPLFVLVSGAAAMAAVNEESFLAQIADSNFPYQIMKILDHDEFLENLYSEETEGEISVSAVKVIDGIISYLGNPNLHASINYDNVAFILLSFSRSPKYHQLIVQKTNNLYKSLLKKGRTDLARQLLSNENFCGIVFEGKDHNSVSIPMSVIDTSVCEQCNILLTDELQTHCESIRPKYY